MSKPSDLVQGTLDSLDPEDRGAWSAAWVGDWSAAHAGVERRAAGQRWVLYPALHKLEQEGWITAEWKTSELGRRAKFYALTRLGRRHLQKETAQWERLSSAISQVVRLDEA